MKTTLFTLLLLCVGSSLRAAVPTVVSAASPLLETKGMVEILMADGSAQQVRKLLSMSPVTLNVMTDGGIGKIPLDTLHPQTLTVLYSMLETPEQKQARKEREAAAAQSYRESQAIKERQAAEENAMIAAQQRAEAARQEAARQAAAEAYAKQQQAFQEMRQQQAEDRAERKAERDAARAAEEREQARALERQRQYEVAMAQAAALQAAANANAAAAQRSMQTGVLAAMMTPKQRAASGVDKLDVHEQEALNHWLRTPSLNKPMINTWEQKLESHELQVMVAWLNRKRFDNLSPAMKEQVPGPPINRGMQMPLSTYLTGNFDGFSPGKIYRLQNGQSWQQTNGKTQSFYHFSNGTKVFIREAGQGTYIMTIQGAGDINVKYLGHY
jgi:chemotaxis protein histidine kinase CheA